MKNLRVADEVRYWTMTTTELREHFLVNLFTEGKLELVFTDADRAVIGSAVPLDKSLTLDAADALRAVYFLERRELGIINVGGKGKVIVGGQSYELDYCDALYVGRDNRKVSFASVDPKQLARFYLLSYPAHKEYPTLMARKANAKAVRLGEQATCNKRTIYKCIHPQDIQSCQLVMGFTVLDEGRVWNTMPTHTHDRRSEIYLYFDMQPETRVIHLMGKPEETRNLVVANRQVVVSSSWSIHFGAGTGAYTFCWGMGGENQDFDDMDMVAIKDLL
jgi:4-deoxy-L-threo-5-hexosulose-uronate ketol-isomerase